ncbi:MAG: hypothetical protein LUQ71_05790 [Methanoregula sp.]|nr:hypothetical protein [Methanoregula sp.]
MTRGRHPVRALEKADRIAKKRGLVHYYERGPGMLADFSITTREIQAEVKIKRIRRIRLTLLGLERDAAEEIAGLRLYPSSHEISRELWIYSPDYFWRVFRILDSGLIELARDGTILPVKSPVFRHPVALPASGAPASVPGTGSPLPRLEPDPAESPLSRSPTVLSESVSPTVMEPPGKGSSPENRPPKLSPV